MDLGELEDRGLYDPAAPDADARRELLDHLLSLGIEPDVIEYADRHLHITYAPVLHTLAGKGRTTTEMLERLSLSKDEFDVLWRTAGLRPPGPDERLFSDADERMLHLFTEVGATMEPEIGEEVLRAFGAACGQIAETAVSAFLQSVERADVDTGTTDVERARFNAWAVGALGSASREVGTLVEHHIRAAIIRWQAADASTAEGQVRFAVGFVDLVGYTTLTQHMSAMELSRLLRRLETAAIGAAADHHGRVVKLIGDEVMFVAVDAAGACEIALTLVETFQEETEGTTPRGGLAVGDMIGREGDYYGPAVNLAARLAAEAIPGEVLVTDEVRTEALDRGFRFDAAGKRMLKGFPEPVRLHSLARGSSSVRED